MSFADKKGITVASGFKLQAAALLDAREQVDTIADRDELVTLNAVTDGLKVYVKETKTMYVWNGEEWDELSKGPGYTHPATHPATMIAQDATHRFVTDAEKTTWNGKVPAERKVNGKALSADITLSAGDVNAIPAASKGAASGVAELDATGKVPAAQLPSYVDDVVEGYFSGGKLYKDAAHTTEITGETGKIYVNLDTNKTYRWSGTAFIVISETIALGETSSTAYRGDRGKTAYDHSQVAHAPADAQPNVQADWNETDTDADSYIKNKPESIPAAGGNADTVNGHTVNADVPANAKFTDTVYTHPATHAATMITENTTHRFVTDEEKNAWSSKADIMFAEELPTTAPAGAICFLVQ